MNSVTGKPIGSPHVHRSSTVSSLMIKVLIALLPGFLLSTIYFGIGILINCVLAVLFALASEALVLKIRQRAILPTLKDGTAVVTALLFALAISPFTSWWVTGAGIAFAIIIAKHLFGGLGNNPFNPAMAGYVFVLLCFPVEMAYWPDIDSGFFAYGMDAVAGATPLTDMKAELSRMTMVSEIESGPLYGLLGGKAWEWIAMAYLAGGLFLLASKSIRWEIPVAVLGSLIAMSLTFSIIDPDAYPSVLFHLFSGGTMLCAFFIATDPASSATTPKGKIIYGCGIGFLIYIIRTWGGYPDGIAFAILIMNALVPFIDLHTRPKVLGEK